MGNDSTTELIIIATNELAFITINDLDKFIKHKNGGDMLLLYFLYIENNRIGEPIDDVYVAKKSVWSESRLQKAKDGLKEIRSFAGNTFNPFDTV